MSGPLCLHVTSHGAQCSPIQQGRVFLRLVRDGERVGAWGETPAEGLGLAPHWPADVDTVVPLPDARAGDTVQAAI